MVGDTKKRILKVALELFAQKDYLGTSMCDIAQQLGLTKAVLYKHYTAKLIFLQDRLLIWRRFSERFRILTLQRCSLH